MGAVGLAGEQDVQYYPGAPQVGGLGVDLLVDQLCVACVVKDANTGYQLACSHSSWCPELESQTTHARRECGTAVSGWRQRLVLRLEVKGTAPGDMYGSEPAISVADRS